ncbi:MAG: response regulator [Spirochaetaceae bacterium]|nr:MAG: response regulator [Spirochaetaceae bacterium]
MENRADRYTIIVVDDEQIIRDGLQRHVDWDAQGYRLLGTCEDGAQAVAMLEEHPVDVIISDISMPFLDGLELSEVVRKRYPRTKVILLTGHDRIEYAQEAVRQHVASFLLKPITPSELREVLASTRSELDQDRKETLDRARLERQLAESMPLLRERILNRIILGQLSVPGIPGALELSGMSMPGDFLVVLVADHDEPAGRDRSSTDVELDLIALQNLVERTDGEPPGRLVFRDMDGRVVCITGGASFREASSEALRFAEDLNARVAAKLDTPVSIGIGRAVAGVKGIVQSYREAGFALSYRFTVGSGRIIEYDDASGAGDDLAWNPTDDEHEIIRSLGAGRIDDSTERVRRMIQDMRERELGPDHCRLIFLRLVARIIDTAVDLSVEPGLVFGDSSPIDALATLKTLDRIEAWLVEVFERWHEVLGSRRQQRSLRKAAEAQEYIRHRSSDPDLSVERVCSAIGVGTSYFSSIFKQHTGKTFVEYLTSLRMERAKELLRASDQLTYEIAAEVGYRDPHYFSNSFKRYCGITPREYRNDV